MFLSLVKPDKKGTQSRNEDINLFCTRYVVILYENIMTIKMEIISDLASSGIIGALLFRVGTGKDRDPRFSKVVGHFIHQLLMKVMVYQPHGGYHLGLTNNSYQKNSAVATKKKQPGEEDNDLPANRLFVARGEECPKISELTELQKTNLIHPDVLTALKLDQDTKLLSVANTRANTATKQQAENGSLLETNNPNNPNNGNGNSSRAQSADGHLPLQIQIEIDTTGKEGKKGKGGKGEGEGRGRGKGTKGPLSVMDSPDNYKPSAGFTPGPGFRKKFSALGTLTLICMFVCLDV